mgnify:FL=1
MSTTNFDRMMEPFDPKEEERKQKGREKAQRHRLNKKLLRELGEGGESTLGPKAKKPKKEPKEKKQKKVHEPLTKQKEDLLDAAYYTERGYQSQQRLLKDVRVVAGGESVTKEDVAEWHAKRFVP